MDWKSKGIAAIGVLSLLLGSVLYSCGGGGGGDGDGDGDGGGGTQIQSVDEGAAAAGAGTAGATAGGTISDIASNLGNLTNAALGKPAFSKPTNPLVSRSPRHAKMVAMTKKMVNSPSMQKAVTRFRTQAGSRTAFSQTSGGDSCVDGGNYTYSSTVDEPNPDDFDITMTYDNCREFGFQYNGTSSSIGTSSDISYEYTTTFTDFTAQTYSDADYTALVGVMSLDVIFVESGSVSISKASVNSSTVTTLFDFISTGNGTMTFDDFVSPVNLRLTNYRDSGSVDLDDNETPSDFSDDTTTLNDTLNGKITESYTTENDILHTVAITYDTFQTTVDVNSDGSSDVSFLGKVTINFTPPGDCDIGGTFTFETVEPLHFGLEDFCPFSGHLDVTDADGNTAHLHFASDGVDVTVDEDTPDEETKHYETCDEVSGLCEVEDFEPGSLNEGSTGGTASGNEMTVSVTWSDHNALSPSSNNEISGVSNLDLHIGYFTSANPSSGSAPDASLSWDNYGGCEGSASETFGTATATLIFDDCDGYGPEGIQLNGLPAGRYVVSVNQYNLTGAVSTLANVAVTIGGSIYSFGPYTFTGDDFDAGPQSNTAAWWRVVDVVSDGAGNVTFEAPDLPLLIHAPEWASFKPRLRR